jgi:hypothetical protein
LPVNAVCSLLSPSAFHLESGASVATRNAMNELARISFRVALIIATVGFAAHASAQELVLSTGVDPPNGPGPLVVIGDLANALPSPQPFYVAPYFSSTTAKINPHGFALLNRDVAVAGHILTNQATVIDIPSANTIAAFSPGTGYNGFGAVAVNPTGSHVLLTGGSGTNDTKLFVVPTPLSNTSSASAIVTLPGYAGSAQTHAISFDPNTGRAYVAHNTGITAIDPPYGTANVLFTIPLPAVSDTLHAGSYAVQLSPDKATLLAAEGSGTLQILHAPFSASSTREALVISGAVALDGMAFVPDGSQALITEVGGQNALGARVYAVSAPYSAASSVETLAMPPNLVYPQGFEDIDISPDGQFAALAGQGLYPAPLVVLRAPFTAAGFTTYAIALPVLGAPYGSPGRGAGTAHFWPLPATTPPQITIDHTSINEGDTASTATLTVRLSKPSSQTISVHYATSDVTAHAGTDYTAASGTLTFEPGATQKTISIDVFDNADNQNPGLDLYFRVLLSNPSNATILQLGYQRAADGVCIIVDDEGPYIATNPPLPDAYVGVPYAVTLATANFSHLTSVSTMFLPTGIVASINGLNITLSGTPTKPSIPYDTLNYFTVVANGTLLESASRDYRLVVRSDRIFDDGFDGSSAARTADSLPPSPQSTSTSPLFAPLDP